MNTFKNNNCYTMLTEKLYLYIQLKTASTLNCAVFEKYFLIAHLECYRL